MGEIYTEKWEILVTKANSVKSRLFSPSDIQSIMKKAIVERLKERYRIEWFPEDGPRLSDTGVDFKRQSDGGNRYYGSFAP